MQLQANKIKVGKRFRQDLGDLESLKSSIERLGLLQPIVISENHQLICGFRRLRACEELGRPVDAREGHKVRKFTSDMYARLDAIPEII